jgi:hypothetical protein
MLAPGDDADSDHGGADGEKEEEGGSMAVVKKAAAKRATLRKRRKARRMSAESLTLNPIHEIEGALLKKSKRGAWQPRYFKTHSHYLLYQRKEGGEFLGGVDLAGAEATIELIKVRGRGGKQVDALRVIGLDGDSHSTGEVRELRMFELRANTKAKGGPTVQEWHHQLLETQVALRKFMNLLPC